MFPKNAFTSSVRKKILPQFFITLLLIKNYLYTISSPVIFTFNYFIIIN